MMFDKEKAIQVILYIANKIKEVDIHKAFKILYFAEREHIATYGSLIVGDMYIAMKNGPVPSATYNIIKEARGNTPGSQKDKLNFTNFFEVKDNIIHPKTEADSDFFSETELECLDASIHRYKKYSFSKLTELSHDKAWEKASKNNEMSFEDIAKAGGAGKEMIKYINEVIENHLMLS